MPSARTRGWRGCQNFSHSTASWERQYHTYEPDQEIREGCRRCQGGQQWIETHQVLAYTLLPLSEVVCITGRQAKSGHLYFGKCQEGLLDELQAQVQCNDHLYQSAWPEAKAERELSWLKHPHQQVVQAIERSNPRLPFQRVQTCECQSRSNRCYHRHPCQWQKSHQGWRRRRHGNILQAFPCRALSRVLDWSCQGQQEDTLLITHGCQIPWAVDAGQRPPSWCRSYTDPKDSDPLFAVMKKSGGIRLVQDFRAQNTELHVDEYSMKSVGECIGEIRLFGSTLFFTIDLTWGLWQILLHPRCRW